MPSYTYECNSCDSLFEVRHSMTEDLDCCILCNTTGSLTKIPSQILTPVRPEASPAPPPGAIVDKYIREAKQEIKLEKEKLTKEMK